MHHSEGKLELIRSSMKDRNIDVLIIPDTDPHMGEYVPDHWRIIEWLTGFTGSAGTVVITDTFAGLWTDSRYFIQAEDQLRGSVFSLIKPDLKNRNAIEWIGNNVKNGSRIGFDGNTFSLHLFRMLERTVKNKDIYLDTECDIFPGLWTGRPPLPVSQAIDHHVSFCGKDRSSKIREVRQIMQNMGMDYYLITSPDDIMWMLNIRGKDIRYSPLLLCFAIAGMEQILLFVEESKIPLALAREFDRLGIVMLPYEETAGMLTTLPEGSGILISPSSISASLWKAIPGTLKITEDISIISNLKSVKNKTEIENISKVMIRDGVALTRFFCWIENNSGKIPMSELSLTEKLKHYRSEQENFISLSFAPIVAFNDHGALPHYSATSETDRTIDGNGLLLVDSGSQYLDGTTDITRTIALGKPTRNQILDFTLVLKGVISLAMAKFPSETYGYQLDILARKALWENGLNYGHGTGHGVGFCLNVHEGPQSISPVCRSSAGSNLKPGMLISDEPAVYRVGEYGIRTENLIMCYEDEETEFGQFLKFNTVSLCYIDRSLIDPSLLSVEEISWLNSYHSEVYEKLSPFVTPEERIWLREKTLPY